MKKKMKYKLSKHNNQIIYSNRIFNNIIRATVKKLKKNNLKID